MNDSRSHIVADPLPWIGAGLLLGLGVIATLRPLPGRCVPPPLPASTCAAWMADALPHVGAKRREAVAAAIRHGDIPPAAVSWFSTMPARP